MFLPPLVSQPAPCASWPVGAATGPGYIGWNPGPTWPGRLAARTRWSSASCQGLWPRGWAAVYRI
ncbi:MAG: hypothetical protein EXS58_05415 [Candidatus Latescibacteria bacterium]|nr:hypothetical protein [Candidatus Latescibacterota bacterium]